MYEQVPMFVLVEAEVLLLILVQCGVPVKNSRSHSQSVGVQSK